MVQQRQLAAGEVEQMNAILQRHHRAFAVLAQGERANFLSHVPALDRAALRVAGEQAPVEAVHPPKTLLFDIPDRAFAESGFKSSNTSMRIMAS